MELCRRYRCKVAVIPDHDLDLRFALLLQRSRAKAPVSEETGQQLREIAAGAELALSAGAKGGAPLGQSNALLSRINSTAERVRERGPEENTIGTRLTPLNWLAEILKARGASRLYLKPDGSHRGRWDAGQIMDQVMMITFSLRRGENDEAKAASTVVSYAKSIIHSHAEVGIDLSFLLPNVLSLHRGLVKTRVDLYGVLKKKKKAPISPRMLQFVVDATTRIDPARSEVAGRAMLIAWECHFRRATITVPRSILKAGGFHPSWHLTLGDITYRRVNGAVIPPVPELLKPLRNHFEWYMTVDPPPEKGDPSGQRHSHSPAICPPIEGKRCAAYAQLERDISAPVTDPEVRASTPLLIDPTLDRALSTEDWEDIVLAAVILFLEQETGDKVSLATARRVYQLHSFRIGATCALYQSGAPLHVRQLQGRWRSMAILEYSRVMINDTILAMRGAYQADFALFHHHKDADLACDSSPGADGEVEKLPPSRVRSVGDQEDIDSRIAEGRGPPICSLDLLGLPVLLDGVEEKGASAEHRRLAIVCGFREPTHPRPVLLKTCSGREDISWPEFKDARRRLFGADVSGLARPEWGPEEAETSFEAFAFKPSLPSSSGASSSSGSLVESRKSSSAADRRADGESGRSKLPRTNQECGVGSKRSVSPPPQGAQARPAPAKMDSLQALLPRYPGANNFQDESDYSSDED